MYYGRSKGFGMYPDQACFDTSRPGWLPYFVDDLTESGCKINLLLDGNTTGNTAQPGMPGVEAATVQNAQAACVSSGGTWNEALGVCEPSLLGQAGPYVWAVAIGLVALVILKR